MSQTIHETQPVAYAGTKLIDAEAAMVMIHGRGGDAAGILPLANHMQADGFALAAPSARGHTWYPNRFIVPREANQPHLASALNTVGQVVDSIKEAGIPAEKIVLLGFSQGACLALEYAARNPEKFGGVVALSGGLIGAEGELTGYEGSLEGTPVFLGCSDVDFHIPVERVHETEAIMAEMGATVDKRIYPGMGHTINDDEVAAVQAMLEQVR